MQLIGATFEGLEDVAAEEILAICPELAPSPPALSLPGRIAVPVPAGAVGIADRIVHAARGLDRIGFLLLELDSADLEAIRDAIAALDLAARMASEHSFAVRGRRRGDQPYTSLQLAGCVGEAVIQRLRAQTGRRAPVDLDRPATVLRAEVDGDRFLLWLDATGDVPLHQRAYRRYRHMASIRASAANLLLRLSGWRDETLIDPFCGSATILIEAGLASLGVAPGTLRDPAAGGRRPRAAQEAGRSTPRLVGLERFARHLAGAAENVRRAGLQGVARLHGGLAEETAERLPPRGRDPVARVVVSNPPFGRRVSSPRRVAALYVRAAQAWARADVRSVVLWTALDEAMGEALEGAGFTITERRRVVYGSSPVVLFRAGTPAASRPELH